MVKIINTLFYISFFFIFLITNISSLQLDIESSSSSLGCKNPKIKCPKGYKLSRKAVRKVIPNGCGSKNMSKKLLAFNRKIGPKFVPCCTDHDLCYGGETRGKINYYKFNRRTCDQRFKKCLKKVVKKSSKKGKFGLRILQHAFFNIVHLFGCKAFKRERKRHHCKKA